MFNETSRSGRETKIQIYDIYTYIMYVYVYIYIYIYILKLTLYMYICGERDLKNRVGKQNKRYLYLYMHEDGKRGRRHTRIYISYNARYIYILHKRAKRHQNMYIYIYNI
jgi:hypothetical protein